MQAVTTKLQEAINSLIEICADAERGFEAAADALAQPILKAEMMQYSRQRAEFVADLQDILHALGGMSDHAALPTHTLHLGWLNADKAFAHGSQYEILAECEQGEDDAVETYSEVLRLPLPSLVGDLVAAQYSSIKRVRDRIKTLHRCSSQT